MAQAKQGDTVKVHYTGRLDDGSVFDSSVKGEPLEFKIGDKQIIPGFEDGVIGMNPGDSKTIKITADKAYGPCRKDLISDVERGKFPSDINPEIGQQLEVHQGDHRSAVVTVTSVSDSTITLDANHPLAGKDLTFDIQLIEIT